VIVSEKPETLEAGEPRIAASILSADFGRLAEEISLVWVKPIAAARVVVCVAHHLHVQLAQLIRTRVPVGVARVDV